MIKGGDEMALKTFNVDSEVYKRFSEHCKQEGLSMSKKIDNFMRAELEKLGKLVSVGNVREKQEHSFRKYC